MRQEDSSSVLESKRLFFKFIEREDSKACVGWFQDTLFLSTYDYVPPCRKAEIEVAEIFEQYDKSADSVVFCIQEKETRQYIGIIGIEEWIKANSVGTLFMGIGNQQHQGKGYGEEALKWMLKYGFCVLSLHRIQLNVIATNVPARRLYEKCGFQQEGVWREFLERQGKRLDLILYGLLEKEWK